MTTIEILEPKLSRTERDDLEWAIELIRARLARRKAHARPRRSHRLDRPRGGPAGAKGWVAMAASARSKARSRQPFRR